MALSHPQLHDAVPDTGTESLGAAIVGGIGLATLTIHLVHLAVPEPTHRVATIGGALVPLLLSLGLLGVTSRWLAAEIEPHVLRIGVWCVVGTAILGAVCVEAILYQRAAGGRTVDTLFVLTNHATVGAVLGVVMGVHDARRHRSEERARAARRRVERFNRRLSVLNRVLRHDLRNAITVILGNAERLYDDGSDTREIAARIVEQAVGLHGISEQAREIESIIGDGNVGCERFDLVPLLEAKLARLDRHHPSLVVEATLPASAHVSAHALLETALDNVLENAVEHNDRPSPTVRVTVDADDGFVDLRVADDGPGIPRRERDVLLRGVEEPLEHTSGLGLWVVAWVARESGGDVRFEANEPRGSVVTIRLPAAEPPRRS